MDPLKLELPISARVPEGALTRFCRTYASLSQNLHPVKNFWTPFEASTRRCLMGPCNAGNYLLNLASNRPSGS